MQLTARKIVITGAAGLIGQNLTLLLTEAGCGNVFAIDKQAENLALLAQLNPHVNTIHADLADAGRWESAFEGCDTAVILHAQITSKTVQPFVRNNVHASARVYDAISRARVPFTIQISSSVVDSVVDDDYARTKKEQERMFLASGLPGCVLRPALMYGWFDPKHFGWLAKFMARVPFFPVPGHGRYMRQPLYARDFCKVIMWCIEHRPMRKTYVLVGNERIDYIDIVRAIRNAKGLHTPIVCIPYRLFDIMLRFYSIFSDRPPFTSSQLKALIAGDDFTGVDIEKTFGFSPAKFVDATRETFCHPQYSQLVVERTD